MVHLSTVEGILYSGLVYSHVVDPCFIFLCFYTDVYVSHIICVSHTDLTDGSSSMYVHVYSCIMHLIQVALVFLEGIVHKGLPIAHLICTISELWRLLSTVVSPAW